MRNIIITLLILSIIGCAGPKVTIKAVSESITLDLTDGSHINGIATLSIPVKTDFGDMAVPLNQIQSLEIGGEENKTASFIFKNGDRLTGKLEIESVPLTTIFGEVSIQIKHIKSIKLLQVDTDSSAEALE